MGMKRPFGDVSDPHFWDAIAAGGHRILVLTGAYLRGVAGSGRCGTPTLSWTAHRIAVVWNEADADHFRSIGSAPVISRGASPGLDAAAAVLAKLDVGAERTARWMLKQKSQAPSNHHSLTA